MTDAPEVTGALDKAAERFRAAVWHDSESDTSGVATALPLIELGSRLALSHFNGAGDKKLVVNAPALAARAAADPGFVDFDMVAGLAADAVLIRPNHTSAELVEDLKRRFRNGKARPGAGTVWQTCRGVWLATR